MLALILEGDRDHSDVACHLARRTPGLTCRVVQTTQQLGPGPVSHPTGGGPARVPGPLGRSCARRRQIREGAWAGDPNATLAVVAKGAHRLKAEADPASLRRLLPRRGDGYVPQGPSGVGP